MIKHPESSQHGEELGTLVQLLAEFPRPDPSLFHLRSRIAFDCVQGNTQGKLEGEFLLSTLRGVGQGLEKFESFVEMSDSFYMSRALAGALPSVLPIGNRLFYQAGPGVVMGEEFGLCLFCLKKLLL